MIKDQQQGSFNSHSAFLTSALQFFHNHCNRFHPLVRSLGPFLLIYIFSGVTVQTKIKISCTVDKLPYLTYSLKVAWHAENLPVVAQIADVAWKNIEINVNLCVCVCACVCHLANCLIPSYYSNMPGPAATVNNTVRRYESLIKMNVTHSSRADNSNQNLHSNLIHQLTHTHTHTRIADVQCQKSQPDIQRWL